MINFIPGLYYSCSFKSAINDPAALKKMKSLKEKRKYSRYQCLVPVEGKEGSPFDSTQTIDISRDGIGFVSHRAIPINEKIVVEIALTPTSEPILVLGVIKWVRKLSDADQYRVGMTFLEVLSGSQSRLNKYLRSEYLTEE